MDANYWKFYCRLRVDLGRRPHCLPRLWCGTLRWNRARASSASQTPETRAFRLRKKHFNYHAGWKRNGRTWRGWIHSTWRHVVHSIQLNRLNNLFCVTETCATVKNLPKQKAGYSVKVTAVEGFVNPARKEMQIKFAHLYRCRCRLPR